MGAMRRVFFFVALATLALIGGAWWWASRPASGGAEGADPQSPGPDRHSNTMPGAGTGNETKHPEMSQPPRRAATAGPSGPGVMPDLVDPRLVPGKPGVGVPEDRPGSWREDSGGDPKRNRAPRRFPEPPLTPPETPARGEGVPPSPQGAGRFAADVAATGQRPERVEPDAATVAAAKAALLAPRDAVMACLGAAPSLQVEVGLQRQPPEGFVLEVRAGGASLPEETQGCLLDAWDAVTLPPPPNAAGMSITLP